MATSPAISAKNVGLFCALFFFCFLQYPDIIVAETSPTDEEVKVISHQEIDSGFQPEEGTYSYDVIWSGATIGSAFVTLVKTDKLYSIRVEIRTGKVMSLIYKLRYLGHATVKNDSFTPVRADIEQKSGRRLSKSSMDFSQARTIKTSSSVHVGISPLFLIFFLLYGGTVMTDFAGATEEPKVISLGATDKPSESDQGEDLPLLDDEQEKVLDDAHRKASVFLIETAEWIDSFFDNPRSLAEENKTRGILRLEFKYSKENDFEFKPRFSLRMELPRLVQQTTQLVFSAAEDLDFDRDSNPLGYLSGNSGDDSGGFVTGVRQFLIEGEEYNIFVEGGIKWWKYAYGGVRFRDLRTFGDWQGRLTSRLRYYTDLGWENGNSYDFDTRFGPQWMFRATTSVVLSENNKGVPHGQYFSLFNVISEYQAIAYEPGITLGTEPRYQVTDLRFKVRYRQRFFRDWLVLEIAPQVFAREEDDYDAGVELIFKLEGSLGYMTDKDGYKRIFANRSAH